MEPADISITRSLSLDGALVSDVLLRLRRDATGSLVRWTLGDHGTFEVDVNFASDGDGWSTSGRIWPPNSLAVVPVRLHVRATGDDATTLTLAAGSPAIDDPARAAIDELAEELLFHGSHAGIGSVGGR